MTALIVLAVAAWVVLLASVAVSMVVVVRCNRRRYDALAERINIDARIGYLTTQTLAAMREAARDKRGW